MSFNKEKGKFSFKFQGSTAIIAPTRIHVLKIQYPGGCIVEVVPNDMKTSREGDDLLIHNTRDGICEVFLSRKD